MPSKGGFALQDRDIELIKRVYELRLAYIDHLARLTGRSYEKVRGRLAKLTAHGYLVHVTSRPQKLIYALGTDGPPVLVEQGHASHEILNRRLREQELKPIFLNHSMMVVEAHTRLLMATQKGPVQLDQWQEGPALYDTATTAAPGGLRTLHVRPDAHFVLKDTRLPEGRNRLHFFLEADRSTESHARIQTKIEAYRRWFDQGGQTRKFNIRLFQVLVATMTLERAKQLAEAIHGTLPPAVRPYYLFTSLEKLSLDLLLPKPAVSPRPLQSASRPA